MIYPRYIGVAMFMVTVATVPILLWRLSDVILYGFGAPLMAILLRMVAEPFRTCKFLPSLLPLTMSSIIVLGCVVGTVWVFGSQITSEFSDLLDNLTAAERQIRQQLQSSSFGRYFIGQIASTDLSISILFSRVLTISTYFLEAFVLITISAVYVTCRID